MICKECKQVIEGGSSLVDIVVMRQHWAGAHPKKLRERTNWADTELFLSSAGLVHQTEPTDTRNDDYSDEGVGAQVTPKNWRRRGPIQPEDL